MFGNPKIARTEGTERRSDTREAQMGRKSYYEEHRVPVLRAVAQSERIHGRPPTVRELATAQSVGVATMHEYLKRLSTEGLIQWSPKSRRSLRLTPQASLLLSPPVPPLP